MNKAKFKIIYNKEGNPCPDFYVMDNVYKCIKYFYKHYERFNNSEEGYEIDTSTENFLTGIRLAVAEGKLNYKDVVIIYEEKEYHLDEYGAYKEVFKLENFQQKLLEKILQANFKMEENKNK